MCDCPKLKYQIFGNDLDERCHRLFHQTQDNVPSHGEFVGVDEGNAKESEEITEKERPANKESKQRT
jgi:hypothetical protein